MNWIQKRMAKARSEEGFTLIELLLVIVVLGILAGVVMFATGGVTDRGQLSACKTDVRNIATAQEAYYSVNNADYADSVDQLITGSFLRGPDTGMHTTSDSGAIVRTTGTPTAASPGLGKCSSLSDGSDPPPTA